MTLRRTLTTLVAATALTAIATPAAAQRVDRVVAFGDSYADSGIALGLIKPTLPASHPVNLIYPYNRFSNGLNFVDIYADLKGAPMVNFAVGGATTGTGNVNAGLPGFAIEWNAALAGGGSIFPSFSGFRENDMVVISIGGNDSRAYQQGGGTLDGAAAAAGVSVAQASAGFNALVNAGAPAISFIAGNTAVLPEVAADPAAQAVRAAYSNAFNAGMRQTLAGIASQGVIVNYADLNLIAARIAANPTGYGLSPSICSAVPTCVGAPANAFLFYLDGVHLTEGGYRVLAGYLDLMADAPLGLQAPSDLGRMTAQGFARTLTDRMDGSAPRDGESETGLFAFFGADTQGGDIDASTTNDPIRMSSRGLTAGVGYGFGVGQVGIAGNVSRPKADVGASHEVRTRTLQAGVFGSVAFGPAFAQAYGLIGQDRHELERTGYIDTLSAEADGDHQAAGVKLGYLMGLGGLRVGPVAAIDYAKASVDGYAESGDPVIALNVDDTHARELIGSLGLEVRGDFEVGGAAIRPYASLAAEKLLDGSERRIAYSLQAASGITNHFVLADEHDGLYGRLTGGASARLSDRLSLDAAATTTLARDGASEAGGSVALRMAF